MKVWGASGLRNLAGQGGILFCCAMAVAILFVLLFSVLGLPLQATEKC